MIHYIPKRQTVAFSRLHLSAGAAAKSPSSFVAAHNKSLLKLKQNVLEWNSSGTDLYAVGDSKEEIYSEFETTMKKLAGDLALPVKILPAGEKMKPKYHGLTVSRDITIPGANTLHPVCASENSRPDFTVMYFGLPVMIMELQSQCEYWKAIEQICLYLFDQFRYLRNISTTFKKWSGYLYAKAAQNHNKCSKRKVNGCVTCVDMKWNDEELAFEVTFKPLTFDEYKEDVKKHLQEQIELIDGLQRHAGDKIPPLQFGIPLSEESITFINTQFAAAISKIANRQADADNPNPKKPKLSLSLEQWPSLTSIIVADNDSVFKYIFSVAERERIRDLRELSEEIDVTDCQFLLPDPERFRISDKVFFRYPRLPAYPMSKEEVRECFHDYAKSVSEALSSMHDLLKYAHCDVRMDNIVFKEKGG